MTAVQIVSPVDDAPAGRLLQEMNRSWLTLWVGTGQLEYTAVDPSARAGWRVTVPVPTVTLAAAARLLQELRGPAQAVIDAAADPHSGDDVALAEARFRAAAAALDIHDKDRVVAVDAGDWIAEHYGTRLGFAREAGVTADTSNARLKLIAQMEEETIAVGLLPYAKVILVGLLEALTQVREEARDQVIAAAAGRTAAMARLKEQQEATARRMLTWGLKLREVGEHTGVSHGTVRIRKQALLSLGMLARLHARVESGVWRRVGESMHLMFDGMLLVAPAAGGEVEVFADGAAEGRPTGLWVPGLPAVGAEDPAV